MDSPEDRRTRSSTAGWHEDRVRGFAECGSAFAQEQTRECKAIAAITRAANGAPASRASTYRGRGTI
jgi:hypothetical protein